MHQYGYMRYWIIHFFNHIKDPPPSSIYSDVVCVIYYHSRSIFATKITSFYTNINIICFNKLICIQKKLLILKFDANFWIWYEGTHCFFNILKWLYMAPSPSKFLTPPQGILDFVFNFPNQNFIRSIKPQLCHVQFTKILTFF